MPRYTVCKKFVEYCGTDLGVEHFQVVLLKFYTNKEYKICIDKEGNILKDYADIGGKHTRILELWKWMGDNDTEDFFKLVEINDTIVKTGAKRHIYIDVCRNSGDTNKKLLVSDIDDLKGYDYSEITPLERDDALTEFRNGGDVGVNQRDGGTVNIFS